MSTPDELHRAPEPTPPELPPPREEGTAALACTQAIELIKQFFTLSSAGVAFVVGLVFADKPVKLPATAAKWSMLLFGLSIAAGCVAYMAVVGRLGNEGRYSIYGRAIQIPAALQMVCFGIGIAFLVVPTMKLAGDIPAPRPTEPLEVRLLNAPGSLPPAPAPAQKTK